jgi:sugar lactone lactonase YvrE
MRDQEILRGGGIYGSLPSAGVQTLVYIPPGKSQFYLHNSVDGEGFVGPNGIRLSSDQSMLYTSRFEEKWVWSYQVQADGSLVSGEPFFRLETPDGSSESGAAGMAVDSKGLLYVATLLGIQICDQQGRVVAILDRPEQADPSLGPVSGIAFGGPDHLYLYAVIGNQIFRRHLVRRDGP